MAHTLTINEINKAEVVTDIAARLALACIIAAGFIASIVAL
ncbi:hypothetical protein [Spongiibacter marinus]